MDETLNEIEYRLSPAHIKHEIKETVHETIDEVRDRFNPQRIARNAGRSMIDTIKDHPMPALVAGLSIGYLLVKAGEERAHRRYDRERYYGRGYAAAEGPYDSVYYRGQRAYEDAYAPGYMEPYARDYYDEGNGHSFRERTSERIQGAREEASEKASELKERAGEMAGEARHRAQAGVRRVRRGARRAENELETFIADNPLAAGAIAIGVGALLGGLLPSTHMEDEWMGSVRDDVVHRAEHVAEETAGHAREAAGHVAEEAKHALQETKDKALAEAKHVGETAREEARRQV